MKPIRHMSTTRALALPATAPLHPAILWALMLATLLLMSIPRLAGAQDLLANARSQYQAAAYDEALTTLQQLSANRSTLSATDARDVEEYRFLCLLALGRKDEARLAMGMVVKSDPLYTLDVGGTPPRVVAAFTEVRRDLLPQIATQLYAESKAAYDKKQTADARAGFEQLVQMLADPDMQGKLSDLGTLAKGFLDVSVTAAPVAAAPAPVAAPVNAVAKASVVVPPVAVLQKVPPIPANLIRMTQLRAGVLELTIDETGRVEEAKFLSTIHPVYDAMVTSAAKGWKYQPAMADGKPIKYRKTIRIAVQAPR
jgi:Gram-negative bacterial TonB protein C-terminal